MIIRWECNECWDWNSFETSHIEMAQQYGEESADDFYADVVCETCGKKHTITIEVTTRICEYI